MTQISGGGILPLYEEELTIGKHTVERGRVNIHVETQERAETVDADLASETIDIERVPIGAFVEVAPDVRQEGNVTIYPVLEEIFVKKLMLREEVRVTQTHRTAPFEETVTLRRQEAVVERSKSNSNQDQPTPNR